MAYMDAGFKKFTSIHDRLANEINKCLQEKDITEWMSKGKTTLIQNDPSKWTAIDNYTPITCRPAQIREGIFDSLRIRKLFSKEQKGCRKEIRGTGALLYVLSTHPQGPQNETEKI